MRTHGNHDCQGAIFILKNDGRQESAWQHARGIAHIRAELHSGKASFLHGLKAWNTAVDSSNAFLAIYSHMGCPGIAPSHSGPIVTWEELAGALPNSVSTLWLAGCKSVVAPWGKPSDSPVTSTLLVTTESRDWSRLVKIFEKEVSLDNITFFDQMKGTIVELLGNDEILYLDASDQNEWKAFESRSKTKPLSVEEMKNLEALLFGAAK